MQIDFAFANPEEKGRHTVYAEWMEHPGMDRKTVYEAVSAVVETLVCWKGWPHLGDERQLSKGAWVHAMETIEGLGEMPDLHVFTVAFESVVDQLQFVSWWDKHSLHAEHASAEEEQVLPHPPVLGSTTLLNSAGFHRGPL